MAQGRHEHYVDPTDVSPEDDPLGSPRGELKGRDTAAWEAVLQGEAQDTFP